MIKLFKELVRENRKIKFDTILKKLKVVGVRKQYQVKISKKFALLEEVCQNADVRGALALSGRIQKFQLRAI